VHDHLADPTQRAVAAQWLVRLSLLTGPPQESAAVAQAALAALPADSVGRRQQLEASELGAVVFGADVPGAAERFAALRRDGFGDGFGACSLAAVTAWDWAFTGGTASECAALAKHALANPHLMTFDHALTTLLAVGTLIMADDEEALGFSETAYDLARGQGSLGGVGSTGLLRAWAWLERGELTEAEAAARQGFDNMRLAMGAESPAVRYGGGFALRALTERGDRAGAQAVRAAIHDLHHGSDWDAVLLRGMAELALEEGDFAGAAQTADGMRDDLRAGANPAMAPWRSLKARAVTGLGRRDEAIELLEDELADARRWSAPRPIGLALRLLGEARGDMDVLREAVDVTAGSIARLEHARALAALGGALRHARKPSDARTPLREAYEIASRSGAQSLAEWTRSELYAAGSRPRRDALSGPDSLTPSERRVAELAAGGQSNRDIAQTLYVTPKTVEVHLTSAYRKLGIARRSGLSEALNLGGHV
jgi:DNA-binding CsgD family transcriptional regulator